jgi:predicted metalloprotease with PDZ domain
VFFAYPGGGLRQKTYTHEDLIEALNAVCPYDWNGFFAQRIDTADQPDPLGGLEKAGYHLVWREEPNAFTRARMTEEHLFYLDHSIGVIIDDSGRIAGTRWGSPGFEAGLVTGTRIAMVNDQLYSADALRKAITAAKTSSKPIHFQVRRNDLVETIALDYHDGLRYPWLEPLARGGDAPLDRLFAPRAGANK